MKIHHTAYIGISVTVLFLIGFCILFITNPQTFIEAQNLSLTSYNLKGLSERPIVAFGIYMPLGILTVIFAFGLITNMHNTFLRISLILIGLIGLIWFFLGIFPIDANSNQQVLNTMLIAQGSLALGSIGILLFGAESEKFIKDNFIKAYSIITGLIIIAGGFISFMFTLEHSFIRLNLYLILFFMWFAVMGWRMIKKASA